MSLGPVYGKGGNALTITPVTGDYSIVPSDQYIVSNGGNTITFPLFASVYQTVIIVNDGTVNDTLDGNGKTLPNSNLLTPTESRGFTPGISEWAEV